MRDTNRGALDFLDLLNLCGPFHRLTSHMQRTATKDCAANRDCAEFCEGHFYRHSFVLFIIDPLLRLSA